MKKTKLKSGGITINILLAIVISLIVNFAYFVFLILSTTGNTVKSHGPNIMDNTLFMVIEVVFYMVMAFILLTIFTWKLNESKIKSGSFPKHLLTALIVSICLYFLAPHMNRAGDIGIMANAKRLFNPMVTLKCSFILVVAALYGKIYELIILQQQIIVENERLKTENLRSRYDVLINQMNPHFFFNSLNSLSMLVRENRNEDALMYIDRMSDTFRYIIQSGNISITTLRDELDFIEAYKYLLELRYAGKLFIDVDVPADCMDRTLPSLTLQPLVENAVKHNTITSNKPLHVSISVKGDNLMVSNKLQPKIDSSEKGTGIGLKNIASRYKLLTEQDITIIDDGVSFTVCLPLIQNKNPQITEQ